MPNDVRRATMRSNIDRELENADVQSRLEPAASALNHSGYSRTFVHSDLHSIAPALRFWIACAKSTLM